MSGCTHRFPAIGLAALVLVAAVRSLPAQTAVTGSATSAPSRAVAGKIKVTGKEFKPVEFAGRKDTFVFYRDPGSPPEVSVSVPADTVEETEFDLKYDQELLDQALIVRHWAGVSGILVPAVTPFLPYLDLKENNAVELALLAGTARMHMAAALARAKDGDPAAAKSAYLDARKILKAVGTAEWFPGAEPARLKATLCLILAGDLAAAAAELEDARNPDIGDAAYGLYWLARAQLLFLRNQYRPALDAAVKSSVFENKDVETFPDALMLCGRCYEELLEPHRARDVYYEVGRLFRNTDWELAATNRLQLIMDRGVTKAKEKSAIENVFFGNEEDINAKALLLLKGFDFDQGKEKKVTLTEDLETEDEGIPKEEGGAKPGGANEGALEAPPDGGPAPAKAPVPPSVTPPATKSPTVAPKRDFHAKPAPAK